MPLADTMILGMGELSSALTVPPRSHRSPRRTPPARRPPTGVGRRRAEDRHRRAAGHRAVQEHRQVADDAPRLLELPDVEQRLRAPTANAGITTVPPRPDCARDDGFQRVGRLLPRCACGCHRWTDDQMIGLRHRQAAASTIAVAPRSPENTRRPPGWWIRRWRRPGYGRPGSAGRRNRPAGPWPCRSRPAARPRSRAARRRRCTAAAPAGDGQSVPVQVVGVGFLQMGAIQQQQAAQVQRGGRAKDRPRNPSRTSLQAAGMVQVRV